MNSIFWTGYCDTDRIAAISELEQIIGKYGDITDFKEFSDISLSLKIELEESKIDGLYRALTNYMNLNESSEMNSLSSCERTIFINITFTSGRGNLRNEILAFPG